MSTSPLASHDAPEIGPPFVGGLLRVAHQHVRNRMLHTIHEAGFTDFQEPHFAVFSYPLPDGDRPSELARRRHMSRQAINYLLSQLEELGYIERRVDGNSDRRLVYLSARGREVAEKIFACLRQLHAEWAKEVGADRFEIFLDVLRELSVKAPETGTAAT